ASDVRNEYLADLSLGGNSQEFVARLDTRFNQVYEEAVERYYKAPPWDLPGVQLAICCYLAWGEVRSVETFTRQAAELGFDRPRLRLLLSKQIYEEMIHHQMFREAAIKMGGVDPLRVAQPAAMMEVFDCYDKGYGSDDVLERIFYAQFCSERAAMPSYRCFKESAKASLRGLHPLIENALNKALHDEPGHVYVGRLAALELADRGERQRERMIEMAADIITITINLWKKETRNLSGIIHLAATVVAAKAGSMVLGQESDFGTQ
ncbi:MAG: hypothetical protein ACREA9_04630, partial [Pyrinomonadaceae bacterium]